MNDMDVDDHVRVHDNQDVVSYMVVDDHASLEGTLDQVKDNVGDDFLSLEDNFDDMVSSNRVDDDSYAYKGGNEEEHNESEEKDVVFHDEDNIID